MFDKPSICLKNETSNFSISFKEWLFPQASHQVNITGYITELKMFENVFLFLEIFVVLHHITYIVLLLDFGSRIFGKSRQNCFGLPLFHDLKFSINFRSWKSFLFLNIDPQDFLAWKTGLVEKNLSLFKVSVIYLNFRWAF